MHLNLHLFRNARPTRDGKPLDLPPKAFEVLDRSRPRDVGGRGDEHASTARFTPHAAIRPTRSLLDRLLRPGRSPFPCNRQTGTGCNHRRNCLNFDSSSAPLGYRIWDKVAPRLSPAPTAP